MDIVKIGDIVFGTGMFCSKQVYTHRGPIKLDEGIVENIY